MKVLKVVFEIPLADKNAVQQMREMHDVLASLTRTLEAAGFKGSLREETIVMRPGRG